jgi:hypothetical protein
MLALNSKYGRNPEDTNGGEAVVGSVTGFSGIINAIQAIADSVRERYYDDIEMFFREGYSNHDCYEINSEVARRIRSELGLDARVAPALFLMDYGVKHYVVEVDIGSGIVVVDAVPELSGLVPSWHEIDSSFVGTYKEYKRFFSNIISRDTENTEANSRQDQSAINCINSCGRRFKTSKPKRHYVTY